MTDLLKTFEPGPIEARWYEHWERNGLFRPERAHADHVELLDQRVVAEAPGVGDAILRRVNEFLFQQGATRCLALGSPAFMRMAARAGWPVSKLGPLSGNHDGQFLAFECSVMNPAHVAAQSLRLQQQPAQGMSGRLH